MDHRHGFLIPARVHRVEEVIQRSRFVTTLAHAPSPEAAHAFVQRIRDEFPNATHHCWAFVAGPPGSTMTIGMSDDGEPHGTAGRPMLTTLLHSESPAERSPDRACLRRPAAGLKTDCLRASILLEGSRA